MMLLMSAWTTGGHGGIQAVNALVADVLAGKGCSEPTALVLHDPSTTRAPIKALGASGSKGRFALLAVKHRETAGPSVCVMHVGLAPIGRLIKALTGAQMVAFVYGIEAFRTLRGLQRWGMAKADRVIAISEFTRDRFKRANPSLTPEPIVCYLPARSLPAAIPGDDSERPRRVLTVGRLWGRGLEKGQDRLIGVWPGLVERFPGWELVVAGDGEGRAGLEDMARVEGVSSTVRFTGAVSDAELVRLYSSSDIFAMPSEGEGFGLVFAEAMRAGLPCVASSRDAGAEVVAEAGIAVDPRDSSALSNALALLMDNPSLRAELGRLGRARAATLFSLEAFSGRIRSLLCAPA